MDGPSMHLLRRNGTYYFRYVLPNTLKARFQASEIKFTLNTYNKTYATQLAAQCYVRCCSLEAQGFSKLAEAIEHVKAGPTLMDKLTPLISLLPRSDTESLQHAFRVLNANNYPVYVKVPGLNDYAYHASKLNKDNVYLPIRLDAHPESIIVPYFDRSIELRSASIDDRTLINFNAPFPVHLHQLHVRDLPESMLSQLRSIAQIPGQMANLPESPLISAEFLKFKEVKRPSWRSPKTLDEYESVMNLFVEVVGDKQVLKLTNDDYDNFILTTRKLPPNRRQPKLRDKSIEQVLAMELDPISDRTLEKYHTRMVTFIEWLKVRHRDLHLHPILTKEKKKASEKKKNKRQPFSDAQLSMVFESDASIATKRKHAYQIWLPVLGLYTGARINELCQLKLTDIHNEAPIPYVSMTDEGETGQIKTESSVRDIPIHPKLIELGFLDFARYLRTLNERKTNGRLFGELPYYDGRGYGFKASSWFAKHLDHLGITDRRIVFHSFRHTVHVLLRRLNMDDWRISRYLGHDVDDDASEGVRSYMNQYDVKDLLPIVEVTKFNIDWTGYRKLLEATYK